MKITVNQLRRIIKEEVQKTMDEMGKPKESNEFAEFAPPRTYSDLEEIVANSDPDASITEDDMGEVIVMSKDRDFIKNLVKYLPTSREVRGGVATGLTVDVGADELIPQR